MPPDRALAASREATRWGKARWARWAEGLGRDEINALYTYKTSSYAEINDGLRADRTRDFRGTLDRLDAAIGKGSVPEAVVAYRGVRDAASCGIAGGESAVGLVLADPAYLSASLDAGVARQFTRGPGDIAGRGGAILRFTLPRGTPAGFLDAVDRLDELGLREGEVLLPRGCSLRVVGAGTHDGVPLYDCTLEAPRRGD